MPIEAENSAEREQLKLEWKKYRPFVTLPSECDPPDLLLFSLPVPSEPDIHTSWPDGVEPFVDRIMTLSTVTMGLGQLATEVHARNPEVNVGICYGNTVRALDRDQRQEHPLNTHDAARMALSSGAKVIGLSLISNRDLPFAREMINDARQFAQEHGVNCPEFIVGGAQASLDGDRTAEILQLPRQNVIGGRAIRELVQFMDQATDSHSDYTDIDTTCVVDPRFLQLPYRSDKDPLRLNKLTTVDMSFISLGGKACVGTEPCAFCTAYHMGQRIEIPAEIACAQIDAFKAAGYINLNAVDNFINLAKAEERARFLQVARYAREQDMHIYEFLSRPDLIAVTPQPVLDEIADLGIQAVFLGIESGDIATLLAMRRARGKEAEAQRYLDRTVEAVAKLGKAGLSVTLSAIGAYPVEGEDGEEADRKTLRHLAMLIKTHRENCSKENVVAKVQLNPIQPYPGSELYRTLVQKGAKPDDLNNYVTETVKLWDEIIDAQPKKYKSKVTLSDGEDYDFDMDMTEIIASERPDALEEIITFLKERRSALAALTSDTPQAEKA